MQSNASIKEKQKVASDLGVGEVTGAERERKLKNSVHKEQTYVIMFNSRSNLKIDCTSSR
jgi:hypothetical protein